MALGLENTSTEANSRFPFSVVLLPVLESRSTFTRMKFEKKDTLLNLNQILAFILSDVFFYLQDVQGNQENNKKGE